MVNNARSIGQRDDLRTGAPGPGSVVADWSRVSWSSDTLAAGQAALDRALACLG